MKSTLATRTQALELAITEQDTAGILTPPERTLERARAYEAWLTGDASAPAPNPARLQLYTLRLYRHHLAEPERVYPGLLLRTAIAAANDWARGSDQVLFPHRYFTINPE